MSDAHADDTCCIGLVPLLILVYVCMSIHTARHDDTIERYIGAASKDEVALVPSTTIALNSVATGLISSGYLQHGDHVLTTDQEHAGGYVGWMYVKLLTIFVLLTGLLLIHGDTRVCERVCVCV